MFAQHPYLSALAGGLLIGIAASLVVVFLGRIAGISGIVAMSVKGSRLETGWRRAFLVGLLLSALVWQLFAPLPETTIAASNGRLVLAGLLVGFGTRLGSGCTSGHGVCGIARLSPRSMVATGVFILSGMLVVWLLPV